MELITSVCSYKNDYAAQSIYSRLVDKFHDDTDGIIYYYYPSLGPTSLYPPDMILLSRLCGVLIFRIVRCTIDELEIIKDEWQINGRNISSPLDEIEDLREHLRYIINQHRSVRDKINIGMVLAFPSIASNSFNSKFSNIDFRNVKQHWENDDFSCIELSEPIENTSWKYLRSILQGACELNKGVPQPAQKTDKLGDAIRLLDKNIAIFDDQQEKASIQIPDGPQMIRGLAGTGKTALLAKKAATIHSLFPNRRILFTFHTQSLYNQAKSLISRFYSQQKLTEPDWNMLHIRHGWGSARNDGVYRDLCMRQGFEFLDFMKAKYVNPKNPFEVCCKSVLSENFLPYYDYILVDEAQDFPLEFFQILYKLSNEPHCIYFAFDELQSLSQIEIPGSAQIFGFNEQGKCLIDLDGEYDGNMDKILVLKKAYRCPYEILMLAHAIGLGIYNSKGCVQMIYDESTWQAIGYEIEQGKLQPGQKITITRLKENSPNIISAIYQGDEPLIRHTKFDNREMELKAVANSIAKDVVDEGVPPQQIMVISLDAVNAKAYMMQLRSLLQEKGIASIIPGLVDYSDEFAEPERVTLSTVYRAKGNEAPIVYIISFDSLYDYVSEVSKRNMAFAAISRSKAWVRITGVGEQMGQAQKEINTVLQNNPNFIFTVPDKQKIARNLDPAESTRRKRQLKSAISTVEQLGKLDAEALQDALMKLNPQTKKQILELLGHEKE